MITTARFFAIKLFISHYLLSIIKCFKYVLVLHIIDFTDTVKAEKMNRRTMGILAQQQPNHHTLTLPQMMATQSLKYLVLPFLHPDPNQGTPRLTHTCPTTIQNHHNTQYCLGYKRTHMITVPPIAR